MLLRLSVEDLKIAMRDSGSIIQWSSVTFLLPLIASLIFVEGTTMLFIYGLSALLAFFLGAALKRLCFTTAETQLKHAFIAVTVVWLVYTGISAIPFVLSMGMTFVDAYFESMSALTTTGLSIMNDMLRSAPLSLILWRSILSWIGGIGIIILALVGLLTTYTRSAKLLIAEGKEANIKPNIKNTSKEIWSIYLLLTVAGVLMLYLSGMNLFDSVNYSMSAISTTGMDTLPNRLAEIQNPLINISLVIIMIMGAASFSVHYLFIRKKNYLAHLQDVEFRIMGALGLLGFFALIPPLLKFYGTDVASVAIESLFHSFSAITCGGFMVVSAGDLFNWGDFLKLALMLLMFIGGCAGSTAGGIKISRFWLFIKSVWWRTKESILPKNAFFQKKFEGRIVDEVKLREINQFILIYALFILLGAITLTLSGNSLSDSFFEVISAQSNGGLTVGITESAMPFIPKVMLIFNMFVGRLEIIPILSAIGFMLSVGGRGRKIPK
jgi:trk system potassium uptake protein TrkH